MLILLYLISFTYHEIPGIFLNLIYKKFYGSNDSILLSAIFPFFYKSSRNLVTHKIYISYFLSAHYYTWNQNKYQKNFLIAQNQPVCHTVITTSVSTSILTNYVTLFQLWLKLIDMQISLWTFILISRYIHIQDTLYQIKVLITPKAIKNL